MRRKGKIELAIGALFISASVLLSGYNIYVTNRAGEASSSVLRELNEELQDSTEKANDPENGRDKAAITVETEVGDEIVYPDYILNPEMEMPTKKINGLNYSMVINIPRIGIELPVLSEYVYDDLAIAPCRYTGSIYTKDMVICAHNYESHFGRLKELSVGDRLTLTDMDGYVFTYEVKEIIVLDPSIVEEFTESGYALTLFTCTYGGASRVTVRCDMVE